MHSGLCASLFTLWMRSANLICNSHRLQMNTNQFSVLVYATLLLFPLRGCFAVFQKVNIPELWLAVQLGNDDK